MRVFFDVDTQNDFMKKDGALYVPGAEELIPVIGELTSLALRHGIQIVGSVDEHYGDEKHRSMESELQRWGGPFPDHCMMTSTNIKIPTNGSRKVNEDLFFGYERRIRWTGGMDSAVFIDGNPILFSKQTYDVFTHQNLVPTLKSFNVTEAYVFGVATDYCIQAAVLGLRKMAIDTYIIEDAIAGVDPKTTDLAMDKMKTAGAMLTNVGLVKEEMDAIYG